MPPKDLHPEITRVRRAAKALERAYTERDEAIVAAYQAGESLRYIAKIADMSPEGVRKLVVRVTGSL
jgi:hypothetical protein